MTRQGEQVGDVTMTGRARVQAGTRMPRERFTEEEDAIILGTKHLSAKVTIERLVQAGYPERTTGAIYQRRHHLDRFPSKGAVVTNAQAIQARITAIDAEIEDCKRTLSTLYKEQKQLKLRYKEALESELAALNESGVTPAPEGQDDPDYLAALGELERGPAEPGE